jgi:sulfhydrogenase subunit delta
MKKDKVKIGIYELTGCAGDALLIIDCEKELIDIFNTADIQSFAMAKSDNIEGHLDVALVEGSVTTEKDIDEVKEIRIRADILVAIGLCATFGGIQSRFGANSNWSKNYEAIYGQNKMSHTSSIESQPIDAYVDVDYYLPGCPIGKEAFLHFFTRMVKGNPPEHYPRPVCVSCKSYENGCLLKRGEICLGPLTADGCGSICINHNLPCIGCWGPVEGANTFSEYVLLKEKGFDPDFIKKKLANFSGNTFGEVLASLSKERP